MSATGGAVAQAQGDVNVKERRAVIEGEVSGQRQDLGLFALMIVQIRVGLRIEKADVGVADRADAGEMSRDQSMFPGEREQAFHHLLSGVKDEQVRRGFAGVE